VYPGNKQIPFTEKLDTHPPERSAVIPCFRIMDEDGSIRPGAVDPDVGRDIALRMYTTMVRLQTMDTVFYDAQRQGRVSFYMTNGGEEGTHIGTAMALQPDDEIFAQYREAGVLMWRGFTLQDFADQVRGAPFLADVCVNVSTVLTTSMIGVVLRTLTRLVCWYCTNRA
jgi:2-oxoisovalerate dehydrogenase E1 component alpha subunit